MIVVWRITTRCNLACPFCAYDRNLPFPRTSASADAVRTFLDTLAAYQARHQDPVLVSWLGGEPLLLAELPALTAHATALGLRVSATTNGTTLGSASVRRHLLDHYSELTVSLDAPGPAHDTLRSAPGLLSALRQNVATLAAARTLKLRVNTVLLRATIDDFPSLAREVASWGVRELTFNALGGRDRPEYFPENRPLPAQLARFASLLPSLREEFSPLGLTISGGSAYLDRLHAAATDTPRPVADCGPAERFLFIDEHGLVSPCAFTTDTLGIPISELRTAADLANLPARFAAARVSSRPRVCDDCPSTQVFEKFSSFAA
jgi:MoaA/NifB/PqqE/SkfB family radical SAM enzyme